MPHPFSASRRGQVRLFMDADAVRTYVNQGYTRIVAGMDTVLLGRSAEDLLEQLRSI